MIRISEGRPGGFESGRFCEIVSKRDGEKVFVEVSFHPKENDATGILSVIIDIDGLMQLAKVLAAGEALNKETEVTNEGAF